MRPVFYDVVVNYVGGYRYSFSIQFAAVQAAYRTSDLVGNDFQDKLFEYPAGTNWSGVDSGLSSLRFRPAENFLLFTSLDKYFEPGYGCETICFRESGFVLSDSTERQFIPVEHLSVTSRKSASAPAFFSLFGLRLAGLAGIRRRRMIP